MAFYRKSYRRRKYTARKTFKKSNLYAHKSAKAQAGQIYKLNKKINYIERKTKPEVKIEHTELFNTGAESMNAGNVQLKEYTYNLSSLLKGDLMRLQNLYIWGTLYARESESGSTYDEVFSLFFRIIVLQQRVAGQEFPTHPIQNAGIDFMNSPYIDGFSQGDKILADRKYYINNSHNCKNFKISIKKLSNLRKRLLNLNTVYDGNIKVYVFIGAPNGCLLRTVMHSKLAYIDEY